MILGTHNSMTYLKPKKWYLYPFQFMARCQSKSIEEQYSKYGVRLFDIRVSYNKNKEIEFRHGLMAYKGCVHSVFRWLNSQKEPVKVRFSLEVTKPDPEQEKLFTQDCKAFKEFYPNIEFYGGGRKYDWKCLYDFNSSPCMITEIYSSGQAPLIDDLFPYLYAKRHNKGAKKIDTEYLMLDFVHIG